MAAAINGIDVIAFTGGVGENAAAVRAMAARGLGFLGIALDEAINAKAVPDADVTAPDSAVIVVTIETREDVEIARQVHDVLRG